MLEFSMRSFRPCRPTLHQIGLLFRVTKSRRMQLAGSITELRNVYKILVEKPEGKGLLGTHMIRLKWILNSV
jgi:hypothetical protein